MTESVIDFPKDGLCPEIWDKVIAPDGIRETYNLKPDVEGTLLDIANVIEEAIGITFETYHITGSITSNSYTENADIDLHFLSDKQYSDEEAEQINKSVRSVYKKVLIGKHPVEVYFQPNKFQDQMSVGCYDIAQHMWLVGPDLTDQSFNPYSEYYKEIHMKSEELAQQIRNMIFSIYEIAVVYKKNIRTDFSKTLRPILVSKLEDVQQMYDNIRQMRKVYSSPESEEQALKYRSSRKWKIADASFKLFDKYGYLAILKQFIEDYKLMSSSNAVDEEVVEDILRTVKHYINNVDKLAEKELFEDEEIEKYDPPYTLEQIKEKYPKDVYDKLVKCPIHKWRAKSGIELIHKEPNKKELKRIWKNWNLMSQEMKDKSDKKSIELFGKTNAEHYKELIDSKQVSEVDQDSPCKDKFVHPDKSDLPEFLYHLTPNKNLASVKSKGITFGNDKTWEQSDDDATYWCKSLLKAQDWLDCDDIVADNITAIRVPISEFDLEKLFVDRNAWTEFEYQISFEYHDQMPANKLHIMTPEEIEQRTKEEYELMDAGKLVIENNKKQVDEGAVQNVLLAALLAIPGILPAKTVQQTIDRNKTYQATMNELNSQKKVRMIGEYTALQAANIIARTLYAEARSDGKDKGFMPVASVIYNRANGVKEDFVKVCFKPLQFSCWNKMTDTEKDPKNFKIKIPKTVEGNAKNAKLWQQAMEIAAEMLANGDAFKPTTSANSYYATSMKKAPSWGKDLAKAKIIGSHKFGYLKNHIKFT